MTGTPLPELNRLLWGSLRTLGRKPRGEVTFDRTAHFRAERLPAAYLEAYRAFFGGFVSEMPLTAFYPLTQRAQLAMMLEGDFPYAAPGMIHVANDLELRAPVDSTLGFDLDVHIRPEAETGRLRFEVTLSQDGAARVVGTSLYQPRGVRGARGSRPTALKLPEGAQQEAWTVPADEGLRYARLSGDFNPIHLSPWLSRWFGFERPIAHGMDSLARVLAGVERTEGRPVRTVSVNFKKPVFLPTETILLWRDGVYAVESADRTIRHLEGTYS